MNVMPRGRRATLRGNYERRLRKWPVLEPEIRATSCMNRMEAALLVGKMPSISRDRR